MQSLDVIILFMDHLWVLIYILQIKDDTKNGFYVENLTEEYVTSYEEVTHILIKVSWPPQ